MSLDQTGYYTPAGTVIVPPFDSARLRRGAALNKPNPATYYGGGAEGYIDYPALRPSPAAMT